MAQQDCIGLWLGISKQIGLFHIVVSTGINFRYGSPRYNFFIEAVYDQIFRNNTQNTVITVAYGGDLRLGNSVLLGYGIRNIINQDFSLKNLIPVASVTCLMR